MATKQVTGWVGWVYFAGFLMMLVGIFQAIAGFVALFKEDVYLVGSSNLLVFDYSTWGWIHLVFGLLLFFSSFSLMSGQGWGRFLGAFLAALSAIANFAFLEAYPIWSILIITMDVLIIYALLVHGGEAKLDEPS
jgi:hypothetical protein